MVHPTVITPSAHAVYRADKMGKTTIFESPRLLVLAILAPGPSAAAA